MRHSVHTVFILVKFYKYIFTKAEVFAFWFLNCEAKSLNMSIHLNVQSIRQSLTSINHSHQLITTSITPSISQSHSFSHTHSISLIHILTHHPITSVNHTPHPITPYSITLNLTHSLPQSITPTQSHLFNHTHPLNHTHYTTQSHSFNHTPHSISLIHYLNQSVNHSSTFWKVWWWTFLTKVPGEDLCWKLVTRIMDLHRVLSPSNSLCLKGGVHWRLQKKSTGLKGWQGDGPNHNCSLTL